MVWCEGIVYGMRFEGVGFRLRLEHCAKLACEVGVELRRSLGECDCGSKGFGTGVKRRL